MKATFKLPANKKQWFSLCFIIFTIMLGSWPIISLFNTTTIIFGVPILIVWSIFIIFFTTFVLWLINKIGGQK